MTKRLLTLNEVAKLLEVNPETVRRFVRKGVLKPANRDNRKQGTPYIFPVENIVRLPRPAMYYQVGAAYKYLRDRGLAPKYENMRNGNQFILRLIKSKALPATQFELNGYWLVAEADLETYVLKHKKGKYIPPLSKP